MRYASTAAHGLSEHPDDEGFEGGSSTVRDYIVSSPKRALVAGTSTPRSGPRSRTPGRLSPSKRSPSYSGSGALAPATDLAVLAPRPLREELESIRRHWQDDGQELRGRILSINREKLHAETALASAEQALRRQGREAEARLDALRDELSRRSERVSQERRGWEADIVEQRRLLQEAKVERDASRREAAAAGARAHRMEAEVESLRARLAASEEQSADRAGAMGRLADRVASLQGVLEEVKGTARSEGALAAAKLQATNSAARTEVTRIDSKCTELQALLDASERRADAEARRHARQEQVSEGEVRSLAARLVESDGKAALLEDEVGRLRAMLRTAEQEFGLVYDAVDDVRG